MKSIITLILVFLIGFISIQTKAELNLGNRATFELKKFYQCRESIEGCSTEQEMQILILEGKTIDKSSLQTGLDLTKQNNEKSFFIPLSLNNQELLILAAATSLGVVAFNNDQEISDTIQKNQSVVANRLESVGNFWELHTLQWLSLLVRIT